jgi:hypothetical protein
MPRSLIPLHVSDLSAFTKALRASLTERYASTHEPPSHLELMNAIARAAGFQNVQSLKAKADAAPHAPLPILPSPPTEPSATLSLTPLAQKTLAQFDAQGRLMRLPNKLSMQKMAVWCLWTRFSPRRRYSERDVNEVLKAYNTFGDHATLRRELIETKLLTRTPDCREYRKLAAKPTPEIAAMLEQYHAGTRRNSQVAGLHAA